MRAALLCLLSVSTVTPAAWAQPEVTIHGESRIELRTERDGSKALIHGYLRDDLGVPLPDRPVEVRVLDASGSQDVERQTVQTDARGAFEVQASASGGRHRVQASFEGDDTHDATTASRPLDLTRADVRLQLQVPRQGRFDLSKPRHQVLVWATSAADGAGLVVQLYDELDRMLATRTTGPDGRVRFTISSRSLGAPGPGRLEARTPGDSSRSPAQTEVPIVRERPSRLTLEAEPAGSHVVLRGTLTDDLGPLSRRAVGLFSDRDGHLATVLTDARGRFHSSIELKRAGGASPDTVRARFYSDTAGRTSAVSAPVALPTRPPLRVPWTWLLIPIGATALLLLWLGRRRPASPATRARRLARGKRAGVQLAAVATRQPERRDVRATIYDSRDDRPVRSAKVTLRRSHDAPREVSVDDQGNFHVPFLVDGRWTIRVEAEGYLPVVGTIAVPHRGQWSRAIVRMESYRTLALRPFRRVAELWLPGLRRWETWTNRELADRARGHGAGAAFDRLADDVERVYYGPHAPTDADLRGIEQHGQDALAEAPRKHRDEPPATNVDGRSRRSL